MKRCALHPAIGPCADSPCPNRAYLIVPTGRSGVNGEMEEYLRFVFHPIAIALSGYTSMFETSDL